MEKSKTIKIGGKDYTYTPKNKRKGVSLNAAAVAHEIIAKVQRGEKINKGKIIKKHGYTHSMSLHPNKVTETKSFKDVVDPFVAKMIKERNAIISLIPKKRGKANFIHLVDGLDKLTKNIQLLSGGDTERDGGIAKYLDRLALLEQGLKTPKK